MKKKIKVILLCFFSFLIVGLSGYIIYQNIYENETGEIVDDSLLETERRRLYSLAAQSGYEGTYEEWLDSIRGAEVLIQVSDGFIQWKYSDDTVWKDLISLDSLTGEKGNPGNDGREIELKVANDYIMWRYVDASNDNWTNLISLDTLTGSDGKDGYTAEFRINDNHIQWKYTVESDSQWRNLVDLSSMKGEPGKDGIGVISITLTSSDGLVDTYTILFSDQTTTTFTVTNGQDGLQGVQGTPGVDGHTPVKTIENGNWHIDGVDTGVAAGVKGDPGNGISSIELTSTEGLVDT